MSSVISRSVLDKILALAGIVIVGLAIYPFGNPPALVLIIAFGALLIYVGGWRTTGSLLHRRANRNLRAEIDNMVLLIRKLYSSRTNGDSARIHETKAALRESLERIISAAAVYQEQEEEAG